MAPFGTRPFDDGPEIPLLGGDVTDGVVRIGSTVRKPSGSTSPAVRKLLEYLEREGFAGAPRYLGADRRDRHVLTFVEGEVAQRPYPAWIADEPRIRSLARLVRRYDDCALRLGVPDWAMAMRLADPEGAPASVAGTAELIAHLDITPENVVFRDGEAFALIDFDLARPGTRAEEVCNMLLWWAPWMPPADRDPVLRDVDAVRRGRILVDAYGLDEASLGHLVELSKNMAARAWFSMKRRSEELGGGWKRMWDDGVGDRILRRQVWLDDNADALGAA